MNVLNTISHMGFLLTKASHVPDEDILNMLRQVYKHTADKDIRENIRFKLVPVINAGNPEVRDWLVDMLRELYRDVRDFERRTRPSVRIKDEPVTARLQDIAKQAGYTVNKRGYVVPGEPPVLGRRAA